MSGLHLPAAEAGPATAVDPSVVTAITQFLGHEARLLDEGRLEDWVGLLSPNICYEVPIRQAGKHGSTDEFPSGAFRVRDNLSMILKRIERTGTGHGWAEDPPSRTIRNVGSICVEATDSPHNYRVHSTSLIYRERAIDEAWDLIPVRRYDIIGATDGKWILEHRRIILAQRILRTPNLGIFI